VSRFLSHFLAVSVALLFLACGRGDPLPDLIDTDISFGSGSVTILTGADSVRIGVEVAETARQRQVGLMDRTQVAPDSGMIFLFPDEQPAEAVFWMYRTLVPLSIAFIGEDGTIGNIVDMEPCASPYAQWCPNYQARVTFRSALEVNRGYFESRGISIGDRVLLERE